MISIRTRLLIALLALVTATSLLAGTLTYRRVLAETSILFDYQLRQMALSLRSQVSMAPRLELPPDEADADFVIQIWDLYGGRVYLSRPGLPLINQTALGYSDVRVGGQPWRTYGLQTLDGVIQIAQPLRVREALARAAALRVAIPLLLLLPVLGGAIIGVVRSGLKPLKRVAIEVQQRDVHSLTPIGAARLPEEVAPLVQELNRLLERLNAAFQRQRAFIADAAHELRSPLTAVRLDLQLLDRAPDEAARLVARANLGAAVDRAIHLLEQLLTLARNEPRDEPDELSQISLEAAAASGIADTHALATARHIDLGLDADPTAVVSGDARCAAHLGAKPGRQCGALYAGGRTGVRAHPQHGGRCAARGGRHGARHPGPGSGARLRPVLSANQLAGGRQRVGTRHREGDRRPARGAGPLE